MKSSLRFWFLALAGLWLATPALRSQSAPPMTGCATSAWVYFDDLYLLVLFDPNSSGESEVFSFPTFPPSGNSVVSLVVAENLIYLTSDFGITDRYDFEGHFQGSYVGDIPPASGRLCPGQVAPAPDPRIWPGVHKVAYGGPGQVSVSAAFQVRDATKINDGFDPPLSDDPPDELPWASVVKGETSDVAKFVTAYSVAAQTELLVSDGSQNVEISPTTGLTAEQTDITIGGQVVAPTYPFVAYATIEARWAVERHLIAQLKVAVLPERIVSLGIYRVWDSKSPGETAPVGGPSNEEIRGTLNSIFRQAGVTFRIDGSDTIDVPFDSDKFGHQKDGLVQEEEFKEIDKKLADRPGKLKLILARNGDLEVPPRFRPLRVRGEGFSSGDADVNTQAIIFTEFGQITNLVAAHEMGHLLGLSTAKDHDSNGEHDNGPFPEETFGTQGAVMQEADLINGDHVRPQPGLWMRHEDWAEANKNAKKYE